MNAQQKLARKYIQKTPTPSTQHTPTPWHIDHTGICASNGRTLIAADDIACEDESEDNAAHIVRCVNAHDELVAALLEIERIGTPDNFRTMVRAALAKVQA